MSKRNKNRLINKNDIVLFVVIIILAFLIRIILDNNRTAGLRVRLTVDGNELCMLELDNNTEYIIDNKYGRNIVVVNDKKVYVSDADCPDRICMEYKPIDEVGETIICLPHRLVIEIVK